MQRVIANKLLSLFSDSFESPFTGSIPQWLERHISFPSDSPNPGKFNIGLSPWLNEVYEAIQDPEIEVIILEAAAQTFKTGVTETIIPYWICNDPKKILKIHHTKDVSKNFTKTRLYPMLLSCEPVKALLGQLKTKPSTDLIMLPNMSITISGPSENFQHGFSVQVIIIDEAHLLKDPGIFEKLFKRTDQYKGRRKIIISTTAGSEIYKNGLLIGDELSMLVNSGRIKRRAWQCPKCKEYQLWKWSKKRDDGSYSGINWGKPITDSDGKLDTEKTSDNAKLECHNCRNQIDDRPENRILLEKSARYDLIKENGDKKIITFQWPAWVASHNSFKEACIQYISAKEQADNHVYEPLKEFMQQVAGEPWNNKIQKVNSKLTYQTFDSESEWAEEKFRFMGVDLQGDGRRFYMVVAFDAIGNARLINYGVVHSWQEIEFIAIKYKVQKANGENAHFVGVDCGYDWHSVASETVKHGIDVEFEKNGLKWKERFGWLCLRGESKDSFAWDDKVKRVVSEQQWYSTGDDAPQARLYFWSNKSIKNLVASIRDGHNKLKLVVNTTDENLQRQLYSEYPDQFGNWKEKSSENHWWDTLNMTYAMAILAGVPFLGESVVVKS